MVGCQTDLHHDMIDVDIRDQDQENEVEVKSEDIAVEVQKVFENEELTCEEEPDNGPQVDKDYKNNDDDTSKEEIVHSTR